MSGTWEYRGGAVLECSLESRGALRLTAETPGSKRKRGHPGVATGGQRVGNSRTHLIPGPDLPAGLRPSPSQPHIPAPRESSSLLRASRTRDHEGEGGLEKREGARGGGAGGWGGGGKQAPARDSALNLCPQLAPAGSFLKIQAAFTLEPTSLCLLTLRT